MSIRDKIRDQLYGSAEDERKSEERAAELGDLDESLGNPFAAAKLLGVCIVIEGTAIALQIFARNWVRHVIAEREGVIIAFYGPFILGFLLGFSGYKFWRSSWSRTASATTSDDMPAITDYDRGEPKMAIWFVSAAAGVLNTLMLFVLNNLWN